MKGDPLPQAYSPGEAQRVCAEYVAKAEAAAKNAMPHNRAGKLAQVKHFRRLAATLAELAGLRQERDNLRERIENHTRELNAVLHPNGDGPTKPALCDLVAYAAGDLRGLRQDALRWRAVRDDLAVDAPYLNGGWRFVGNEFTPHPGPAPHTVEEAADRLASRSLPGALKEEKDND